MFHQQVTRLEVRQKYSAARPIFNSLLGVSSGDETLRLALDVLRHNQVFVHQNSRGASFWAILLYFSFQLEIVERTYENKTVPFDF